MNEKSFILWYQRLRHISIKRIKILINDEVFKNLDFTDFNTYVDCIKEKPTKMSKKGVRRSFEILKIIRTDIYYHDMDLYGQKYFISFSVSIHDTCIFTCLIIDMKH